MFARCEIAPTCVFQIVIAGDYGTAHAVCREFCMAEGFCVTLERVEYIYTGGAESGIRVGCINYPRFPASEDELLAKVRRLACLLRERLHQHSYSIIGPSETEWFTVRPASGGD